MEIAVSLKELGFFDSRLPEINSGNLSKREENILRLLSVINGEEYKEIFNLAFLEQQVHIVVDLIYHKILLNSNYDREYQNKKFLISLLSGYNRYPAYDGTYLVNCDFFNHIEKNVFKNPLLSNDEKAFFYLLNNKDILSTSALINAQCNKIDGLIGGDFLKFTTHPYFFLTIEDLNLFRCHDVKHKEKYAEFLSHMNEFRKQYVTYLSGLFVVFYYLQHTGREHLIQSTYNDIVQMTNEDLENKGLNTGFYLKNYKLYHFKYVLDIVKNDDEKNLIKQIANTFLSIALPDYKQKNGFFNWSNHLLNQAKFPNVSI